MLLMHTEKINQLNSFDAFYDLIYLSLTQTAFISHNTFLFYFIAMSLSCSVLHVHTFKLSKLLNQWPVIVFYYSYS